MIKGTGTKRSHNDEGDDGEDVEKGDVTKC